MSIAMREWILTESFVSRLYLWEQCVASCFSVKISNPSQNSAAPGNHRTWRGSTVSVPPVCVSVAPEDLHTQPWSGPIPWKCWQRGIFGVSGRRCRTHLGTPALEEVMRRKIHTPNSEQRTCCGCQATPHLTTDQGLPVWGNRRSERT